MKFVRSIEFNDKQSLNIDCISVTNEVSNFDKLISVIFDNSKNILLHVVILLLFHIIFIILLSFSKYILHVLDTNKFFSFKYISSGYL